MRAEPSSRARNCSSSSDGASAAWRSSSTSTIGRLCGGAAQELGHRVEQAEARRLGSSAGGSGRSGKRSRSSGTICARSAAPGAELGAQRVRVGLAHMGAQRLDPRPVRGRAARLPAAADEHLRAARAACAASSSARRLLPMPGSPTEQEEPPAARERVVEAGEELGQLGLAADEHAARARGRRRGRWRGARGRAPGPARGSPGAARAARPGSMPSSSDRARARVAVGLERLGLAAAAVEGEHQLAAEPLAERMLGHERLELAHQLGVAPRRGRPRSAARARPGAAPPAARSRLGERLVRQVGERRPARARAPRGAARRRRGSSAAACATSRWKRARSSSAGRRAAGSPGARVTSRPSPSCLRRRET